MIKIVEPTDLDQWRDFVYNHPRGNIFQAPEMAEVYRRTKNYEPVTLVAINTKTHEIMALLQGVIIKELGNYIGKFSSRLVIQGGPLYINKSEGISALKLLIEEYSKLAKRKALFTEVRNMWDTSNIRLLLSEFGYKYEEHLNFLIDLNRSEKEIWSDIHKSRRKGINRAAKKGITTEKMESKRFLKTFYELVHETYKKAKIPLADLSLFESAFDILAPNDMAKFYVAKQCDCIVGARVVLNYKGLIYDWYAGSSLKHQDYYINEALVWHILKEHADKGFHTFDFGGAGKPNEEYGVREFKRRFGGKLVNFGRYKKIHSPIMVKIAKKGFEMYKKIKHPKI